MDTFRTLLGFPFVLTGLLLQRLGEWIGGGDYNFDNPYERNSDERFPEPPNLQDRQKP